MRSVQNRCTRLTDSLVQLLHNTGDLLARRPVWRELARAQKLGVSFVALGEPDYPLRLQMIDDAPPLITLRGNVAALALPRVAVVGSRNASVPG